MKLLTTSSSRQRGSILLVSLCTMVIIGIALLTFLELTKNQNQLVARSQVWNACLPIAEAGMEEGLQHANTNPSNWVSNGWALSNTNTLVKSNVLSSGWYTTIISTNMLPTNRISIRSTGYVKMSGTSEGIWVSRTVEGKAWRVPPYRFALYGKGVVNLAGNGVRVDSYDSRDPLKSTNGRYDPTKAGDKADIATYNGTPLAVYSLGNGNVWGKIYMGPGGTATCGVQGKAGSVAWQNNKGIKSGIEAGWLRTDLNVSIPDVILPFPPGPYTVNTPRRPPGWQGNNSMTYYNWDFHQNNTIYTVNTAFASGDNLRVSGTNVIIYMAVPLNVNTFTVMPGASAMIYCASNATIATVHTTNTVVANSSALSTTLMGLKNCVAVSVPGGFTGIVYAPYAHMALTGNTHIYGSFAANSLEFKGGAQVHFDEAIRDGGLGASSFKVYDWDEL
ncbi:MAG: hypothetical protein RJA22_2909 [Verrucomicrobiota bacterium]|jgi:Tfp pilus assembly protein PilX